MSKEPIDELSEGQMSDMFINIGRAKEATARSIIKQQEEANEAKRRSTAALFGNSASGKFDETVDLDEMERRINAELEIARRGTLPSEDNPSGINKAEAANEEREVKLNIDELISSISDSVNAFESGETLNLSISQDEDVVNAFENAETLDANIFQDKDLTDMFENIETLDPDIFQGKDSLLEIELDLLPETLSDTATQIEEELELGEFPSLQPELEPDTQPDLGIENNENVDKTPTIPEFEDVELLEIIDIVAPEKDKGYLSIVKDEDTGNVGYALVITLRDGRKIIRGDEMISGDKALMAFKGALELFKIIEKFQLTAFILCTDSETCNLLKRNATYGIVDGYSESCVEYISQAKKISEKCYLRITESASDLTSQYMALAATTAKSLVCGIDK